MITSKDRNEGYKDTFDYLGQFHGENTPKVSIHESGQIHIHAGANRTKELHIPKLPTLKDEHIASVTAVAFAKLSVFTKEPKSTGKNRDIIIECGPEVESGRIRIYVNGVDETFLQKGTVLTLERKTLSSPLYYCISPIWQSPLDGQSLNESVSNSGVIIITGWDPRKMDLGQATEYHYLIGE